MPSRLEARYCETCGSPLPAPAVAPPLAPFEDLAPLGDIAGRFAALERHPEAARLLAHEPTTASAGARTAVGLVTLVVFLGVGLLVTVGFSMVFPPMVLVPLTLVVLGAVMIARNLAKAWRAVKAPLVRAPALLTDERTRISGGGEDRSVTTEHFATLEFRDGTRRELEIEDELAGRISPGDMGIAFLKGDYLVDFGRVPV